MSFRVTDSYLSSILVGDLNRSLGNMLKQQRMAGSMRRVNSFADDPRAVGSIQRYNALIANNDEYTSNITRSRIIVDGTDVALQDISSILTDVRVITMRESSALATDESMGTAVVEVENLANRLMDVLNTNMEGNYIFSGRATSTPAFVRSGSSVVYQGDDQEIRSRTGPNSTMAVNIPGSVFMGAQSSALGGSVDMAPKLQPTTLLSNLDLGAGWQPGSISITDGTGATWQVDLSSSLTVGDVTTAITAATGGVVTAGISADGTGFSFAGTAPITVSEFDGGTTAASLGINGTSGSSVYNGRDVRPPAGAATNLANIDSLTGKLPLGTIDVDWQGTTYNVDLSGAVTLGDLQTTLNGAVPGMELVVRNSSLELVGSSPEMFSVANGDATNTASALGLVGEGSPVRLFGMLEDLQTALANGDKDAIHGTINELTAVKDKLSQLLMKNGGRQTDLDWAEGVLNQRNERLRGNLSLERDADIAQVAADLSQAETSYQSSLLVTSKLYQSNLMQYLR